jgi:ferredoxin
MNRSDPRAAAQSALAQTPIETTGLIEYDAGHRLLVIGQDPALIRHAVQQAAPLRTAVLCLATENVSHRPLADATTWYATRDAVELDGWLGAFRLRLSDQGDGEARFDQVLDLSEWPLFGSELPPPGYLTATAADLDDRLATLRDLTGRFEKPKYFRYDPDICAHGMKGATACTRCIDACPADAISSLVDRVQVEPHLCQGGGACATACPSGAMTYSYPSVEDSLERMRRMLRGYREAGGEAPILLLHDAETGTALADALLRADTETARRLLPFALEELASLGIEAWLTALAYGACAVRLLGHGGIPAASRAVLDEQLVLGRAILDGLGYPADALGWTAHAREDGQAPEHRGAEMPGIDPARHAALGGKRQILFQAIDHLHDQAARQAQSAEAALPLPDGAPLGTVLVDDKRCTLCMACVTVCPGKALQHGQDVPQLRFLEASCVQCGLCVQSCPESAVQLTPRLLLDAQARNSPRLMNEDSPFHCMRCGSAFATRSVIGRMQERLAEHAMFATPEARRRLQMCGDCRVADMMQAGEL